MQAGLLWLGAGIGLGILAKGPVILLHVLPVAVIAPWWAPALRKTPAKWYLGILGAVLLGAAIALAWALPAGYFGGDAYRGAIFWDQTAGRAVASFAHRRPWWYYVPLLPLILFPWLLWPALWRGVRAAACAPNNTGVRFLTAWLMLTVVDFSLVSGKQAQYLLPMVPAFALLAGYALAKLPAPARWREMMVPAFGFLVLPVLLAYARASPSVLELSEGAATLPVWPIVVMLFAISLLLALSQRDALTQVRALAFAVLCGFAVLVGGVVPSFAPYGDPYPTGRHLAALQRQNIPLAHLGKYHAQYNFAGRLQKPIQTVEQPELAQWVAAHPSGQVILVEHKHYLGGRAQPAYEQPFRNAWIQIWHGDELLAAQHKVQQCR
jgi:4-amino-4-deoxy-L-arabinose transferase-like glycosyltransferase